MYPLLLPALPSSASRSESRRNIRSVRVTLNGATDTAYIYLKDFEDEDVARHYILVEHDVAGDFKFEFDKKGRLLGIEVKFASSALPPGFLDVAEWS